jgi:hypothetical protein
MPLGGTTTPYVQLPGVRNKNMADTRTLRRNYTDDIYFRVMKLYMFIEF